MYALYDDSDTIVVDDNGRYEIFANEECAEESLNYYTENYREDDIKFYIKEINVRKVR